MFDGASDNELKEKTILQQNTNNYFQIETFN